jgi:hypothetical protein
MNSEMSSELKKALLAEDELGLVVRSHLYVENLLDKLLALLAPFPEYLEEINLSYASKVRLVCVLGFDPDFKPMLLELVRIRNKFAHNLSQKIDLGMVKNLHSLIHSDLADEFPKAMRKIVGGDEYGPTFKEAHPRDQFTALVITLWVVMCGAVKEVNERQA